MQLDCEIRGKFKRNRIYKRNYREIREMKKISIILPYQILEKMESLNDHEFRLVIKAIAQYEKNGTTLETGNLNVDLKIKSVLNFFEKGSTNKELEDRKEKLFEYFWTLYPRKRGKEQAKKTWLKKLKVCKNIESVDAKVKKIVAIFKATNKQWIEDQRDLLYIPYLSSWLNSEIPDKEK
jgi:hypothetical protein